MNVICLQDDAFYALLDEVVNRVMEKLSQKGNKWIKPEDAMKRLNITSRTTLQKLRDEGKIEFTQPQRKIILYDADSIETYLQKHKRKSF